jgi:hypothetical protein
MWQSYQMPVFNYSDANTRLATKTLKGIHGDAQSAYDGQIRSGNRSIALPYVNGNKVINPNGVFEYADASSNGQNLLKMKANDPSIPANVWLSGSDVPNMTLQNYVNDLNAKKKAADIAAANAAVKLNKPVNKSPPPPTKTKASIVAGYA